jgi:hypothetical protein
VAFGFIELCKVLYAPIEFQTGRDAGTVPGDLAQAQAGQNRNHKTNANHKQRAQARVSGN